MTNAVNIGVEDAKKIVQVLEWAEKEFPEGFKDLAKPGENQFYPSLEMVDDAGMTTGWVTWSPYEFFVWVPKKEDIGNIV